MWPLEINLFLSVTALGFTLFFFLALGYLQGSASMIQCLEKLFFFASNCFFLFPVSALSSASVCFSVFLPVSLCVFLFPCFFCFFVSLSELFVFFSCWLFLCFFFVSLLFFCFFLAFSGFSLFFSFSSAYLSFCFFLCPLLSPVCLSLLIFCCIFFNSPFFFGCFLLFTSCLPVLFFLTLSSGKKETLLVCPFFLLSCPMSFLSPFLSLLFSLTY